MTAAELDRAALLRSICERPGDDVARLVYADWLEESGEEKRAEFIRVQIQRHRAYPSFRPGLTVDSRTRRLVERERELFTFANLEAWGGHSYWERNTLDPRETGAAGIICACWHRGFVDSVSCPLAAWLTRGPALVPADPITVVRASDKRPALLSDDGGVWGWYRFDPARAGEQGYDIYPKAWGAIRGGRPGLQTGREPGEWKCFDGEQEAQDALSAALVNHAREMAGLPPLA